MAVFPERLLLHQFVDQYAGKSNINHHIQESDGRHIGIYEPHYIENKKRQSDTKIKTDDGINQRQCYNYEAQTNLSLVLLSFVMEDCNGIFQSKY